MYFQTQNTASFICIIAQKRGVFNDISLPRSDIRLTTLDRFACSKHTIAYAKHISSAKQAAYRLPCRPVPQGANIIEKSHFCPADKGDFLHENKPLL